MSEISSDPERLSFLHMRMLFPFLPYLLGQPPPSSDPGWYHREELRRSLSQNFRIVNLFYMVDNHIKKIPTKLYGLLGILVSLRFIVPVPALFEQSHFIHSNAIRGVPSGT